MNRTLTPAVQRIVNRLQDRILSGAYPGGQWLPTERLLAEEFAVSRATIRLALAEIELLGLVSRASGCRPLVRPETESQPVDTSRVRRSLGLWISGDPTDVGGAMTVRGITGVLDPDVYRIVVAHHCGDTLQDLIEAESLALARFERDRDIEGLILWYFGGQANRPALEALREAQIPMVFVDRRPPYGFEADYVGVHNERAAQEAVQHLLALGHRRIAHVTNPENASTVAERLEGYRRALAAAGIAFRADLVVTAHFMELQGTDPALREAAVIDRLLSLSDPPTALFVVNDFTAQSLTAALAARGVRVPEDIAVVGFDDEERWKPGAPFLTTVRQPFEHMGAEAARLLLERLRSGPTQTYRHLLLDAPLVTRHSTVLCPNQREART
jgi:LacI family transcriptional regulator